MAETMTGLSRTHYCGETIQAEIGDSVVVTGFAHKNRDKGSLVFIDLRDRTGIVQLVCDDQTPEELRKKAASVRSEYVLMAKGTVRERSSKNPELETGDIEIFLEDLRILSKAETPPFAITDETKVNEELRLRHRYLDLRRGEMQYNLIMRHKIVKAVRDFFDEHGFLEIETPVLIKSTPEGARDYLVPSRVHPGSFYALPQSPQLYKQLLMCGGYDRYMQIARCFRDEDLRADRQPEFTQIDVEMSYVTEEDILHINEEFMKYIFKTVMDLEIQTPFKRLTYKEAMNRYGSDKPDTRFEMELVDLTEIVRESEFRVFSGTIAQGGIVGGINVKGAAEAMTRREIDGLTDFVKDYGAKGLAFTRLTGEESSSYEKFLSAEEAQGIRQALGAEKGDLLLVVGDGKHQVVYDSLGALRVEMAKRMDLIPKGTFDLLWVTEFPLFEYDEEEERYVAVHHPFTSPNLEDIDLLETQPGEVRARAYDIVLNGTEVGGGSIRINDPELQEKMFGILGLDDETIQERFGFLLEAFKYGVPPHGGIAYGLDRLVMLLLDLPSIREVIAFPKVQNASDLMSGSPAPVEIENLEELHIQIADKKK